MSFNRTSAAEAASLIRHGYNIGLSGSIPTRTAKAVTVEPAKITEVEHAKDSPFQVGIFAGASTGESCDGVMFRIKTARYRVPYTTNSDFRKAVNNGEVAYNDIHLSQMAQEVHYGFMGKVNVAIIEACEVTPDRKIYLTAAGGISSTTCRLVDQIIVELNAAHSESCMGLHDVYEPLDPPYRHEIPIHKPSDRIGSPYIQVGPKETIGVVRTNWPDEACSFVDVDPLTDKTGQNVIGFLAVDMERGIIPSTLLPLQSGVGNIANAVLGALGRDRTIPVLEMYTEAIRNSAIGLIHEGRTESGSACSLITTNDCLEGTYNDMDSFRDKLALCLSGIPNNPEAVRRLGIISINIAIGADLYGNVNSTHIGGTKVMNGIGGSGDFTHNAYISIFTCPSVVKEGKISVIAPVVSHLDYSEHSVNIIITEQSVADLRGKSPKEHTQVIIENCAHLDYKQLLWDYLKLVDDRVQTPHAIQAALGMHAELARSGGMKNTNQTEYARQGMKRPSLILPFIVCICVANTNDVFSQKKELQQSKGKVTSLQGEPVRAASIYIPGTGRYTSSDMNGDFPVETKHKETLRFSHIGTKDVLIQLDKDFLPELFARTKPDTFQINNIFIQKKQVIKVKSEDMSEQTMINFIINGPDSLGGLSGFDESVEKNIQYPEEALQAGEEGQVIVESTVNVNGYVSDAKVIKSVSASLDKEALRIIESMSRWKSSMQLGRPAAVRMSVPIDFVIEQDYQATGSSQVKTNT